MTTLLRASLVFLLVSLTGHMAQADEYDDAINSFRNAGASSTFFDKSIGYAIFPSIGKGGIGVGGAHGTGRVYKKGELIGTASMTQLTIGFQLGGEVFSQIIFFETEAALDNFTSGNFEFSADASAVAITAGASATASTGGGVSGGASGGSNNADNASLGFRKGMAIFTVAKGGLMYQATLGGQKYSFDPI